MKPLWLDKVPGSKTQLESLGRRLQAMRASSKDTASIAGAKGLAGQGAVSADILANMAVADKQRKQSGQGNQDEDDDVLSD